MSKLPHTTVVVTHQRTSHKQSMVNIAGTAVGQKSPKMAPFSHHLLFKLLKTTILRVQQCTCLQNTYKKDFVVRIYRKINRQMRVNLQKLVLSSMTADLIFHHKHKAS